jgi:hypothetical protein
LSQLSTARLPLLCAARAAGQLGLDCALLLPPRLTRGAARRGGGAAAARRAAHARRAPSGSGRLQRSGVARRRRDQMLRAKMRPASPADARLRLLARMSVLLKPPVLLLRLLLRCRLPRVVGNLVKDLGAA